MREYLYEKRGKGTCSCLRSSCFSYACLDFLLRVRCAAFVVDSGRGTFHSGTFNNRSVGAACSFDQVS